MQTAQLKKKCLYAIPDLIRQILSTILCMTVIMKKIILFSSKKKMYANFFLMQIKYFLGKTLIASIVDQSSK